jgi:glycosyltransferase involved in cell wall biosynthesis
MARITVVTAGHLSTCPRMVKAADALCEDGHDVHVISSRSVPWATAADNAMRRTRTWRWTAVDHTPGTWLGWRRALRSRVSTRVVDTCGADRAPWSAAVRAYAPIHPELRRAVMASRADLIYGGTTGALAAAAGAAASLGVLYALDLEDLHVAESVGAGAARQDALATRVERRVLSGAAFLTTSSESIAEAYRARYQVEALAIHNVLPRGEPPVIAPTHGPLRLCWVGQVIGPDRGIEEAIEAVGTTSIPATLHVRGRETPFADQLRRLAVERAPLLELAVLPPIEPDRLVESCRDYDIGLAGEPLPVENRRLCISNKLFLYLSAGLAVVVTTSPGHSAVIADIGAAAVPYAPGDVAALAAGLRRWHEDREQLASARRASWAAAGRRWHWEHPEERGGLLSAVTRVLG